jgi:hypothetical protein
VQDSCQHNYHLYPICCFNFCFCRTISMFRSFQFDFRSLMGRLPTYLPFSSFMARVKSAGSVKLTNPKPFVLLVLLSLTTLALWNDGNRPKVLARTSSVTSLPRSPQKIRKSLLSHSFRVSSSQTCKYFTDFN